MTVASIPPPSDRFKALASNLSSPSNNNDKQDAEVPNIYKRYCHNFSLIYVFVVA